MSDIEATLTGAPDAQPQSTSITPSTNSSAPSPPVPSMPSTGGIPNSKIAQTLIASGGDVPLVLERLNAIKPHNCPEITIPDVVDAFLSEINTNSEVQNSVKGLALLNLLTILTHAKDQFLSAMGDMGGSELQSVIRMAIEGIATLLPTPPIAAGNPTQVNILQQFGSDQARERVSQRLATLATVEAEMDTDE